MGLDLWLRSFELNGHAHSHSVQRTIFFVYLLNVKKAITFSSSSLCYLFSFVYYLTVQSYIERFNLATENIELFKCS